MINNKLIIEVGEKRKKRRRQLEDERKETTLISHTQIRYPYLNDRIFQTVSTRYCLLFPLTDSTSVLATCLDLEKYVGQAITFVSTQLCGYRYDIKYNQTENKTISYGHTFHLNGAHVSVSYRSRWRSGYVIC